ncbi:MAG: MBL fold metallo-hydrolase [SAR86 cluster bacterium]|mgnify:FL=1|jgi:glyoxylase-like metal-dependent hydrolase (beta-lactamase superfamily II)|nr:MBL fold metallo-hydrolase [SAR86 cluster bacterium]
MNQWKIGDVLVTRIVEMEVAGGTKFILPEATREACLPIGWMQPNFMDSEGNLIMSIHALIIDTGEKRIIVDTCVGNDKKRNIPSWSNLQTNFLKDLKEAGYPKESIDLVMCTHLHVDHVGWNTMLVNNEWIPTFSNARYLIAEKEWRYWDANEDEDLYGPVIADSVRPIVDAEMVDFVDDHFRLCKEVSLIPTPGHTPGHVSVLITSKKKKALITGDFIHHPVQMTKTDWCSSADYDQAQGQITRETLLEKYVDRDILIIGTHFATPTAGYIKRLEEGGYWLDVRNL